MKKNIIIFVLGAAAVILLDQITKAAILKNFFIHESRPVIEVGIVFHPGTRNIESWEVGKPDF